MEILVVIVRKEYNFEHEIQLQHQHHCSDNIERQSFKMPYIGPDGNVTDRRSKWRISIIKDAFVGIVDAVLLFFRSVTQPPSIQGRTTYAERNGVNRSNRSNSNVRGVGGLSRGATAMPGGG